MALFLPFLASGISAGLQYAGQKKQLERDEARNRTLQATAAREAKKRQSGVEGSFGVDKYTLEALEKARGKEGVKEAQDQANISSANQLNLAARLGGRGGLNVANVERIRQQNVADAGRQQRVDEARALQTTGAAKQADTEARRRYEMGRMTLAEQQEAAAQQNLWNAQDSQKALRTNFATGIIDAAMPLFGSIGGGGTAGAGGAGSTDGSSSTGGFNFGQNMMGGFNASGGYQFPTGGFRSWKPNENGGKIRGGKKGMRTPGEFSHASNPINLIQNGAKVGEVTGGEYVVNPQQAKRIARQSAYARSLFRNFDNEA